jgi:hypothetical protein
VTICAGDRRGSSSFYRLRDGSQERELPGSAAMGLGADRFQTVPMPGAQGNEYLIDLVTGKSGDLGLPPPDANGQFISVDLGMGNDRMVAYPVKDKYVIIDLTKIR